MDNNKIYSNSDKMKKLNPLKPPLSSSLGHLAYGHLAFMSWRKLKREKMNKNE